MNESLSPVHKKIVWTIAAVLFFEFADLNTFSYAAPALKKFAGFTLSDIALVTSAGFLGMFFGAVVAGRVSDRIGRRRTLTWTTALFSVFSLLTATGSGVWILAGMRFCTGAGLSAMTVCAISYLSEMMPAARRGRAQSTTLAVGLAGIPAIAFLSRAVIPLGSDGWRIVFIVGGLAVFAVPLIARLPESPRWLLHSGQQEAAREVIAQLGGDPANIGPATDDRGTHLGALATLVGRRLRRRTAALVATWVLAMLGFYAFAAWVPALLAQHGLSLTTSLTFSAITTIGAVPGALLARAICDRFSRRWIMVATSVVIAACGIAYGYSSSAGGIIVFGLLVSLLSQTFVAVIYTYTPEVFPMRVRAFGCGLSYGAGRLANVFGPLLIPTIYIAGGYTVVFIAVAACWIGAGVIVALFGPETTGVSLESVDDDHPWQARPQVERSNRR